MAHAVHEASRRAGAFLLVSCPELHTASRPAPVDAQGANGPAYICWRASSSSRPAARCSSTRCTSCRPSSSLCCSGILEGERTRRLAGTRCACDCLHHARHDTRRSERPLDALFRTAVAPPNRRTGAGGSPRGHSGDRRALRAAGLRGNSGKKVTGVLGRVDARGSRRTAGQATSASFAPSSSARSWSSRRQRARDRRGAARRGTGGRKLSSRLAARLRRHGRGLARQASTARAAGGREADSSRRVSRACRAIGWCGGSSARRRSPPRLRSPHTVQLYDFGVNDTGSFYYVMELLNGLDLQRIVTRFGPQPAERVIMLLRQACRSLAEAHEHGLVHRDIKPANLFVDVPGPRVRLHEGARLRHRQGSAARAGRDAALRRRTCCRARRRSWRRRSCSASGASMAGPISIRWRAAPVWALTGQLLFQATTPAQMLLHHAQTPPAPPSEMSELPIPRQLDAILMRVPREDAGETARLGVGARRAARACAARKAVDAGRRARVVGQACARGSRERVGSRNQDQSPIVQVSASASARASCSARRRAARSRCGSRSS